MTGGHALISEDFTDRGRDRKSSEVCPGGFEGNDSSQSSDGLWVFLFVCFFILGGPSVSQSGNRDGQFGQSLALAEAPRACLQPVWVSD